MSKRLSLPALAFAVFALAVAILSCSMLNSGPAVIIDKHFENLIPEANRLYSIDRSLSTFLSENGKILHGTLSFSTDNAEERCLYLPNAQHCSLEINGETYTAKPNSGSITAPLASESKNSIIITVYGDSDPSFENMPVYLVSEDYGTKLENMSGYQRFFIIGMSAALCLYALSLYGVKSSEKYLLLLVFLAYSTSARTLGKALPALRQNFFFNLILLGTVNFPWLTASENYNLMFMLLKTLIAVLRFLLISEFVTSKERSIRCIRITLVSAFAVIICCILGVGYYPIQVWQFAAHMMELYLLTTGEISHPEDRYTLLAAWAFTLGLRIFDTLCVSGVIAHGFIEAAVKPQGIIETFYILAFVIVINRKFARKFKEADSLSHSLEEANRNLEKKVDERTAELEDTCSQLQHIQNQKSEFIANIVHNLKSPLFSLYGYTDMALDSLDIDSEHTRYCLQEINNNTEYVRQLIEKLSLCMRLENSSVQFNKVPLNVKNLLEQILSTSMPTAEAKNVAINVSVEGDSLSLVGDALYLRQAIQNIVDNGIRHSGSGSEIQISAKRDGNTVSICIRDEGEGMPEEQRKLIFGRYYSQNKSGATSSGLGLTIAMEIVSQHGGTITVESELGKGSAFTILLPAAQIQE